MNPLAAAIAAGLEAARIQDEERIRQIVREELANLQASAPQAGWLTPPRAAKARGISLKRVRALMDAGAVEKRAKGQGKHSKWEVSLASLDAALAGPPKPVDAGAWAAARLKRGAA